MLLGRLAESRRRENGFLLGVGLFTVASAACGAADDLTMLVAFRILQALGAALLTPTSLSLVLATTSPERRHGAVRAWTAIGGLAAALGPVVGGLLVAASWRWVFLVNVPIGIAAVVVGWRRLPRVPGHPVPRPDALGALLVTAGVAALTLGAGQGQRLGLGLGGHGGLPRRSGRWLWRCSSLHCARHHNPLIDGALFRVRTFSGASLGGARLLDLLRRHAALDRAVGPERVGLVGAADRAGRGAGAADGAGVLVPGRRPADRPLRPRAGRSAFGATVFAARRRCGGRWPAGVHPDYVGDMLGGMLLTGVGVGLTLPTFMATGASSLPAHAFATGSAVVNMLRQVGLAIGVAVLVAILGTPDSPAAALTAFRHGWEVIAGVSLLAAVSGAVLLRRPRAAAEPAPAERPASGGAAGRGPEALTCSGAESSMNSSMASSTPARSSVASRSRSRPRVTATPRRAAARARRGLIPCCS